AGGRAECGSKWPRGERVRSIGHQRKEDGGQTGGQQYQMIVAESAGTISCERIAYPCAVRRIPVRAESDDLREIVGSAGGGELFENRKIESCLGSCETPPQK